MVLRLTVEFGNEFCPVGRERAAADSVSYTHLDVYKRQRLVRANDGYVVWTDTYDRALKDKLQVQDEIASEVAKALKESIN